MSSNSKMSKPLKLGQSSPLDKHARRDILHSFRCPRDCRDFEDAYASIIGCPFGHYDLARKKVLPSFVCVPYLLDECPKKMTSDQLLFCEDGFHLADRDLLDLEQFTKRMADYVLQRGPLESKPEFELTGTTSLECCICFAPFNGIYGQLSDCTHVFCAKCITDWFKKERNCPVCRKSSRFIIAWHGLIASKEEKAKIARMQAEMVKVSDLNDTAANTVTSSTSQPDYGFDWNRLDFDFPTEFIQGEAVEPIILTPHSHLPGGLYDPLPNYLDSAISAFTAWQGSVGAGPITSRPPQSSAGGVNRPARTALLEPLRTVTTAPREQIQAQVSTNNYSRGGAAASNWRGGGGGNGRGGNGHGNRGGQAAHGRSNFYRGNNRGYRGGGGSGNTRGHFNYNFY